MEAPDLHHPVAELLCMLLCVQMPGDPDPEQKPGEPPEPKEVPGEPGQDPEKPGTDIPSQPE